MAIDGNSPRKAKTSNAETNETQVEEIVSEIENQNEDCDTKHDIVEKTCASLEKQTIVTFKELSDNDISDAEEYLQQFLLETLGHSDSRVYDAIKNHAKKVNFISNSVILRQGDSGKLMYILLNGAISVMSSNNDMVSKMGKGAIFGEMSLMFNTPISANIQAINDVIVVTVPKKIFINLMKGVNDQFDVIDWHISRRYIPLGKHVDSGRIYRRLALSLFKTIPIVQTWTPDMMKKLILSLKDEIVTLYPEGSFIVMDNDPIMSVSIVIKGKLEIKEGERTVAKVDVDKTQPYVFTETALYFDNPHSCVNIQAISNCQIIQLRSNAIKEMLNESPSQLEDFQETTRQFRAFVAKMGAYYKLYEPDLQIEILTRHLKASDIYAECSRLDLRKTVLKSDPEECFLGQRTYVNENVNKYESILLVKGELVLMYKITNANDVKCSLDNYLATEDVTEEIYDIEIRDNDSGSDNMNEERLNTSSVVEVVGDSSEGEKCVIFKNGDVILLAKYEGLTLTAKSRCLLLKISGPEQICHMEPPTERATKETENAESPESGCLAFV